MVRRDELIASMTIRLQRLHKVKQLAHDPRIIEMVQASIEETEADIQRLRADTKANADD